MLFRIEETNQTDIRQKKCGIHSVEKERIDEHIASLIRKEVNGSKDRMLLSYSKSLAACLLKYNEFTDNELHIYEHNFINLIKYRSPHQKIKNKPYRIAERIKGGTLFNKPGEIQLLNFIVDVSNNELLNLYLKKFTDVSLKCFASPEKDSEVVVMRSPRDLVINDYIDAVYILYALQLKYQFLKDESIQRNLMQSINSLDEFRFEYCPGEREAILKLVRYLSYNWEFESRISKGIYKYSKNTNNISIGYNSIAQYHNIMRIDDFKELNDHLSDYNDNVVSDLIWTYCGKFLGYSYGEYFIL